MAMGNGRHVESRAGHGMADPLLAAVLDVVVWAGSVSCESSQPKRIATMADHRAQHALLAAIHTVGRYQRGVPATSAALLPRGGCHSTVTEPTPLSGTPPAKLAGHRGMGRAYRCHPRPGIHASDTEVAALSPQALRSNILVRRWPESRSVPAVRLV